MKKMRLSLTFAIFACVLGIGSYAAAQSDATSKNTDPSSAQAILEGSDVNSLRAQRIEKASMELMKHPTVLEAKAQGLKS